MTEYHTIYERPEGESTEWEDIQRKIGNLPAKEPVWKPDAFSPEQEQSKDKQYLDNKDIDELDELDDDFADDRFLEQYRLKRIQELQQGASKPRFGTLEPIRGGQDFVAQVTNAGDGIWVVCHLYKDNVQECSILNACLTELSQRYPNTKFVKIISTDCIPNYPDDNLPTILLYKDTKCVKSMVGLNMFGGKSTSPDRIALILNQYGDVCGDSESEIVKRIVESAAVHAVQKKDDGSDEDSDFD